MPTATLMNLILDIVLIAASAWTVATVRGMGGIIGKGLNLITIGIVILGIAHLLSTGMKYFQLIDAGIEPFVHRVIVLVGFIVLVLGFRQINRINQ
jgi:hypothetical protein